MIKIVQGDLLRLAEEDEFHIIVHGCNCFNDMGAGIAGQIRKKWPKVYEADCKTVMGSTDKLGDYSSAILHVEDVDTPTREYDVWVVNAYIQLYPGANVDYTAVRNVLLKIHKDMDPNFSIGIPRIGAGIAGGDWQIIENMIVAIFKDRDVTIVAWVDPCFQDDPCMRDDCMKCKGGPYCR